MPYDEPDHDDPMEFVAVGLPALSAEEEDEMVRCVIEEYCWMGWDEERLHHETELFRREAKQSFDLSVT